MMIPLLIFSLWAVHVWACPPSCSCKWKGGKQTVECINKSLITIPQGIDPGTQVLEFSGNNLDRLLRERFQKMGLINLQKIFMPRCRIKHIEDQAFSGLTNLVELDLSDNILSQVPTPTFSYYRALMKLNLNGNPIKSLKTGAFEPLQYLNTLDLSMCDIESVEDGAFQGLINLEWLKLDNNKISYIKGSNILPENLHGVDLHQNPWQCDCKLLDLRSWLQTYQVPQSIEPVCASPSRLKGYHVKDLDIDDLACVPDVSPTALYLEIGEGRNVSLLCRVSAIPEAKVSWWFQGNVLQNDSTVAPGLHLYYFVEEGSVDKTSELFIFNTNAEDNGTFACVAENPAGKSHSNYTIRIILKEEPVIRLTVFPYEYIVIISATLSVFLILFIICVSLCVVQCKRNRRRKKKKDRSKGASIQTTQGHADKATVAREPEGLTNLQPTRVSLPAKVNGAVINKGDQEMVVFSTEAGGQIPQPVFTGPGVTNTYPEKNPDLINDTGSKEWRREDLVDGEVPWNGVVARDVIPKHLTADVHLSPSKFIGPDGYPIDYGLPKIPAHYSMVMPPSSFYRTLPHKTRHQGVTPRFSREAEFVNKTVQPAPFEHYSGPTAVRYTAEGYPGLGPPPFSYQDPFLSPPAPYKSDACAQRVPSGQWSESSLDTTRTHNVAAQTGDPKKKLDDPSNVLTESPDEGYEGETNDSADI